MWSIAIEFTFLTPRKPLNLNNPVHPCFNVNVNSLCPSPCGKIFSKHLVLSRRICCPNRSHFPGDWHGSQDVHVQKRKTLVNAHKSAKIFGSREFFRYTAWQDNL